VRKEIAEEEERTKEVLAKKEEEIEQCLKETAETKELYQGKIAETRVVQDSIRQQRHQLHDKLQFLQHKNKLLYFYPVKVRNQEKLLERKKVELELYQ